MTEPRVFLTLSSTNEVCADGTERHVQTHYSAPGMTLRDYFAAQAIPDAMRSVAFQQVAINSGEEPQDAVARIAYDVADAMMRRREVSP